MGETGWAGPGWLTALPGRPALHQTLHCGQAGPHHRPVQQRLTQTVLQPLSIASHLSRSPSGRLAVISSSVGGCPPVVGATGCSADLNCDVHPESLKGEFPQPGQLLEQGGGGARFQLREQSVGPGGAWRQGGGEADRVDRVPGPHSVALHRD